MAFVIFDLDGTLADITHRLPLINKLPGEKDWPGFFAACVDDKPIIPMAKLCNLLYSRMRVDIWSGRSDEVRAQTVEWLNRHNIAYNNLVMRKKGDHRADDVVKREWAQASPILPDIVFEDRYRVVEMWRSLGVTCCQVAEGDF